MVCTTLLRIMRNIGPLPRSFLPGILLDVRPKRNRSAAASKLKNTGANWSAWLYPHPWTISWTCLVTRFALDETISRYKVADTHRLTCSQPDVHSHSCKFMLVSAVSAGTWAYYPISCNGLPPPGQLVTCRCYIAYNTSQTNTFRDTSATSFIKEAIRLSCLGYYTPDM